MEEIETDAVLWYGWVSSSVFIISVWYMEKASDDGNVQSCIKFFLFRRHRADYFDVHYRRAVAFEFEKLLNVFNLPIHIRVAVKGGYGKICAVANYLIGLFD